MKKEESERRTREVKVLLENYYKDEKEIAYVVLLQAPTEKEGCYHINLISNVKPPIIVPVVSRIMRMIGSLINRQN